MRILKYFSILIKTLTYKKSSYSYSSIDSLIQNIFKNINNGYYVDVGCGHPVKNNNTYLLSKKGWSGINIDLDQDNIDLFNIFRKKDLNISAAISDKKGETDLFFYHSKSALNTISEKNANYQSAKVNEVKKIKTITLNEIIENSVYAKKTIDFLSIDVEGSEYKVLKNFNFERYKPKIIVIEYLDLSLSKLEIKNLDISKILKSELYTFIKDKGYTLINMLHSDLVFTRNDFRD